MNFLRFEKEEERELYSMIRQQNVLVIDDVTTSGSTLNEVLRTLRILNEDNEITIFSLIGRKDLMAESMWFLICPTKFVKFDMTGILSLSYFCFHKASLT